jgi:hypothetical protein
MAKKSSENQQAKPRNPNLGGKRPGAGRPKKAVTAAKESIREVVVKSIGEKAPKLLQNLYALADAGDRAANEYLLNRLLGKPTEHVESHVTDAAAMQALEAMRAGFLAIKGEPRS